MRSRALPVVALAFLAMFFHGSARADSLTGLTVTGSLMSHFPVVTPFPSSAVIGAGVEFQGVVDDIYGDTFDISANFTDSSLIIAVTSPIDFANVFSSSGLMTLSFSGLPTDLTGFALTDFTCISTVCSAFMFDPGEGSGLDSNSYSGSTLNLDFNNILSGQTYTFSEEPPPSAVPEPSTLLLLSIGLAGAVGVSFRRRRGVVAPH
jgi:hypothetical protein